MSRIDDDNLKSTDVHDQTQSIVFTNVGLERWENGRRKWLDYNESTAQPKDISKVQVNVSRCLPVYKKKKKGSGAQSLNIDNIIDLIVSNRWRLGTKGGQKEKEKATFEKPVPLPQMVDILVDLWEAEGMDV